MNVEIQRYLGDEPERAVRVRFKRGRRVGIVFRWLPPHTTLTHRLTVRPMIIGIFGIKAWKSKRYWRAWTLVRLRAMKLGLLGRVNIDGTNIRLMGKVKRGKK